MSDGDVDFDDELDTDDDLDDDEVDDDDLDDDDLDDDDEVDADRITGSTAIRVLQYLLEQIVDEPGDVRIEVSRGRGGGLSLEVQVGPGDMGRVIGRRGRTASAIRTVVRAAAAKDGTDAEVEFVD